MRGVTRRAFLAGAGGAGVLGAGVLVGEQVRSGDGRPQLGRRVDGVFDSVHRRAPTAWSIAFPHGADPAGLPLLVCLHGALTDHTTLFGVLGIDRVLARAVSNGAPPYAVAAVDGGSDSFWYPQEDGTDAGAMVLDEFVPMLRDRFDLASGLALYGFSMGGYGGIRLATLGAPVAAVAASSPALFAASDPRATSAFPNPAAAVLDPADFPDIPLWIDCGKDDPFYAADRAYVDGLATRPSGGFGPGKHSYAYWRRMLPGQLAFIGEHLG